MYVYMQGRTWSKKKILPLPPPQIKEKKKKRKGNCYKECINYTNFKTFTYYQEQDHNVKSIYTNKIVLCPNVSFLPWTFPHIYMIAI